MAMSKIKEIEKDYRGKLAKATARVRVRSLEQSITRKASGVTAASVLGVMKRQGVRDDLGGFPWKVGAAALAQIGEAMTKGNTQAALAGIADAITAVYVENAIATGSIIAGGDVDDDEMDDDEI